MIACAIHDPYSDIILAKGIVAYLLKRDKQSLIRDLNICNEYAPYRELQLTCIYNFVHHVRFRIFDIFLCSCTGGKKVRSHTVCAKISVYGQGPNCFAVLSLSDRHYTCMLSLSAYYMYMYLRIYVQCSYSCITIPNAIPSDYVLSYIYCAATFPF